MENEIVSEETNKPIRDEQTLAKVLEAAYVLQEHNRELRNKKADPKLTRDQLVAEHRANSSTGVLLSQDTRPTSKANSPIPSSTLTLAQIVEIQHQVQVRHLELENVMALVAERLSQFAGASGAAIGILDGTKLHYRAAAGVMALRAGTEIPAERALAGDCLRTGQVLRCVDVNSELQLHLDECRRRGIRSVLAVPVFHDGVVAGSLELYFPETQSFTEEDIHACQLMAGLVSEALARNEKVRWKKSLATERSVMLAALEKLRPSLAALADSPAAVKGVAATAGKPSIPASASSFVCSACGHELVGQEQFCGNCGSPRSTDYTQSNLQSTIATLWHMQEAMQKTPRPHPGNGILAQEESQANLHQVHSGEAIDDRVEELSPKPISAAEPRFYETTESREVLEATAGADFESGSHADLEIPLDPIPEDDGEAPKPTALAKPERSSAWSSAATTLDFFQQLAMAKDRGAWAELWNTRRGDIYLAIAVVLLLGAIRWGIWSNHSVSARGNPVTAGRRGAAPDADLPLFDRVLIKMGLAEAPEPPEYKGNPATQVWVDLQTALYYCPGADLYGKTAKGRFSSQRAARLDQFEPAFRKACD